MTREFNRSNHLSDSISNIETTIGELILTITEIALKSGKSEAEAYHLATLAVNDMLNSRSRRWVVDTLVS